MERRFLIQLGLLLALVSYGAPSTAAERAAVEEIGTKTSSGLEVTLIAAPPRTQAEMKEMMTGMGGMGMMKGGMGMMEMSSEPATHYLGVIIRNQKNQKVIPDLKVTLTAKGSVARRVELMSMPGSYAQNISLPRGRYEIIVKIDFPQEKRKPVEVRFQMEV